MLSKIWYILLNYFKHFGWIASIIIIFLLVLFIVFPLFFHWILLVSICVAFFLFPKEFIYLLVGGRRSLRTFFLLFIITQFLFSFLYYSHINNALTSQTNTIKANVNQDFISDNIDFLSYREVLINTFYIGLVLSCPPKFEPFISEQESKYDHNSTLHESFFVIMMLQIFISWLYLGVLIATLYQKLTKQ